MIIDVTSLLLWLGALVRRVVSLLAGRRISGGASVPLAVLGEASDGRVVTWPAPSADRACSAVVLGSSGAGKSVLIASMIAQQIAIERRLPKRQRTANVICDPKGDLAKLVVAGVAALAPDRLSDLTILSPFNIPIPLNLCLANSPHGASVRALSLAELVSGASAAVGDHRVVALGPKQVALIADLLEACITARHPARSALWAIDALTVDGAVEMLGALATSPRARRALGGRINRDLADSCAARLRAAFSLTEDLEAMVGASSCIDINALTRGGAITIIDLSGSPTPGLRAVWSSIVLRRVIDAALARPSPFDGHHLRISQDECHLTAPVLSASAEELATTGRSKGASAIYLSQGTVLLDRASPALVDVLLTNSPTQIVGRVGAPDAKLLSRFVSPSPGVSESVGAVQGVFAATVANLADRTFIERTPGGRTRFRSADVDLAAWTEAAERHASAIERAKTRWMLDRGDGERVTLEQAATEGLRPPRRRSLRKLPTTNPKKIDATATPTKAASEPSTPVPASTRWG